MLPGKPEGAGPAPHSADPQPQQPQASQQAGHEAERVIKAAGPQPEQPGEAGVKLKPEAVGSPKPSPAPSTSTMGAAGAPEEGAAAAAAATAAAAAGGGHPGQPPGKAPAAGGKQGKKKVVRSKEEFNEVWKKFMKSRQLDASPQQFNRQAMDLFKLFRLVIKAGGYQAVLEQKGWARIGRNFSPPQSMTDLSYQIKKAYINKLLAFEEAYNAEQIDAEIVLEAGGTPEPAAKAPPKRKAAVPAGECGEQPKAKRERQQPKQPQPQQQQQQRKRAKEEHEGAGLVVASPQAPQHPPSRPRAKQARPSHKRAASPKAAEAGKGGRSAKAATRLPSTAAGRGGRQDGGVAPGPEARPPSGQRGKRQRMLQRRTEPPEVAASPEALVSRRIGVFWADDEMFYHGTVVAYNPATERHTVQYDDGDREDLMLAYEDWAFLDKHQRAAQAAAAAAALCSGTGPREQPGPSVGAAQGGAAAGGAHPQAPAAAAPRYQAQLMSSGLGPHEAGPVQYAVQPGGIQQEEQQQAQQQQQAQAQQPLGPLVLPDFAVPSSGVPPLFRQASADDQALLVPSLHPQGSLPGMLGADGDPEPTPRHTAAQTLLWVANGGPTAGGAAVPGRPPAGHPAAQQQQWLYQSQQQFAPHGAGYSTAYGGYPASGPLPAAHAASLGLPPLPPRPSGGVGALAPPPAAHRPTHDLVAQGRNFRAYTTMDPAAGYEVFALVPGLTADEVIVRCWSSGVVLIEGQPATSPTGPGASPPLSEHVQLPTRIDTRSAVAQLTPTGQLYLRVNAV